MNLHESVVSAPLPSQAPNAPSSRSLDDRTPPPRTPRPRHGHFRDPRWFSSRSPLRLSLLPLALMLVPLVLLTFGLGLG